MPDAGIRAMCTINVAADDNTRRVTQLLVCADDVLFVCNADGTVATATPDGLLPGATCQGAAARGKGYFVDGTDTIVELSLPGPSPTADAFVPTAGDLPGDPRLITFYLDCMVLACFTDAPQDYGMSRIGDFYDWDASKTDTGAPVLGNAALGHNIGQPINALAAGRDRQLVFFCDHSMWRMIGHPRQGGTVMQISDKVGISGRNAWDSDPAGNIYFVADTGFYVIAPDGGPTDLSSVKVRKFFNDIDRGAQTVSVCWDQARLGCWIFVTGPAPASYASEPANVHLFYDVRRKGFWRVQFPLAMDPVVAVGFDGDSDDKRLVMMGARDGFIRVLDDAVAIDDQGVPITSYVHIGPLEPGGFIRQARCTGVDFVLGEVPAGFTEADNWHVDWQLRGGDSAYAAVVSPLESYSGSISTAGRQAPQGLKLAAGCFGLKLSNSTAQKFWSLDRAAARFAAAGKVR